MSIPNVVSNPVYPAEQGGTLLIVGSAPNLYEDMNNALNLKGSADIMALNEAGGAIKNIDHLYAGHYDKTPQFMAYRMQKQPEGNMDYKVHACWSNDRIRLPLVHYWWTGAASQGTSAFTAARIGRAMGYDEIILCGCPLDGDGYFNAEETHRHTRGDPRVGFDKDTMRKYQERFALLALHDGDNIYSMSGFTKEALGEPRATD